MSPSHTSYMLAASSSRSCSPRQADRQAGRQAGSLQAARRSQRQSPLLLAPGIPPASCPAACPAPTFVMPPCQGARSFSIHSAKWDCSPASCTRNSSSSRKSSSAQIGSQQQVALLRCCWIIPEGPQTCLPGRGQSAGSPGPLAALPKHRPTHLLPRRRVLRLIQAADVGHKAVWGPVPEGLLQIGVALGADLDEGAAPDAPLGDIPGGAAGAGQALEGAGGEQLQGPGVRGVRGREGGRQAELSHQQAGSPRRSCASKGGH